MRAQGSVPTSAAVARQIQHLRGAHRASGQRLGSPSLHRVTLPHRPARFSLHGRWREVDSALPSGHGRFADPEHPRHPSPPDPPTVVTVRVGERAVGGGRRRHPMRTHPEASRDRAQSVARPPGLHPLRHPAIICRRREGSERAGQLGYPLVGHPGAGRDIRHPLTGTPPLAPGHGPRHGRRGPRRRQRPTSPESPGHHRRFSTGLGDDLPHRPPGLTQRHNGRFVHPHNLSSHHPAALRQSDATAPRRATAS